MILWEIFKALNSDRAGLDSGADYVYNIFKREKQHHKEATSMEREVVFAERMEVCQGHPEKAEIFWLEQMLIKAGYPYYFNFWEELKPTPFNQDGGKPEKDIDWNTYKFLIEVDKTTEDGIAQIIVCFNTKGDPKLLEIVETKLAAGKESPTAEDSLVFYELSAEQAMEIIEKFFKETK